MKENTGSDPSGEIEDAMRPWDARRQDEVMEKQFSARRSSRELAERKAWKAIQAAAAQRIFGLGEVLPE